MKILFITDLYPVKDDEVCTPKTLKYFVEDWQKSGNEVFVLKPNFLLNSFIRKKPFYRTGLYKNVYNVNYLTPFLGKVKNNTENFLDKHFDMVIAHMPSGILYADKLGMPFAAGIHNSDIAVLTNPLYRVHFKPALLKALRNSKCIACRSFVLKDKLLNLYPEFEGKTFAAPSGICEEFIIEKFEKNIDRNNLNIITCANFKKRKNIDKLIIALKDIEGVSLTVIGDGSEKPWLERLCSEVKFTGRLNNSEVLSKMRESDIFILPSVGETFGMVYLEAMASGCITICTENDGVDGIIKNKVNGFTVKPDIFSIKETIQTIKKFPQKDLDVIRRNSLDTVKNYTREACALNYLENVHKFMFK